jgi:hypothetical protein
MSELTARYVFAMLCALGMLAIGVGAVLEVARFRRNARQAVLRRPETILERLALSGLCRAAT